jgi:hypothetical protein
MTAILSSLSWVLWFGIAAGAQEGGVTPSRPELSPAEVEAQSDAQINVWRTRAGLVSRNKAKAVLIRIGAPAVPALLEVLHESATLFELSTETLGALGEEAKTALPQLLTIAADPSFPNPRGWHSTMSAREVVIQSLWQANGAAERVTEVLGGITLDVYENPSTRKMALRSLGKMGQPALPMVQRVFSNGLVPEELRCDAVLALYGSDESCLPWIQPILDNRNESARLRLCALRTLSGVGTAAPQLVRPYLNDHDPELRKLAHDTVGDSLKAAGPKAERKYYARAALDNPLGPDVRYLLLRARGPFNPHGVPELTRKIKKASWQRLEKSHDPQLALNLAGIIQDQVSQTDLQWNQGGDGTYGRMLREDPQAHYGRVLRALELGFQAADLESELGRTLGIAIAKLHLMEGRWQAMNQTLEALGEKPIKEALRPRLTAPPKDWQNLSSHWLPCAERLRSGKSSFTLQVLKEGQGLAGAHVLLKEAPEWTGIQSTGYRTDTLFYAPHPVPDSWGSFGFDAELENTRYAVTGPGGVAHFAGLPKGTFELEVLIPTASFREWGVDWEILQETDRGELESNPPGLRQPLLIKEGQQLEYRTLHVRPKPEIELQQFAEVSASDFTLRWQPLASATTTPEIHYELEMAVTPPSNDIALGTEMRSLSSLAQAAVQTKACQWPVATKGVGNLSLVPGNLYLFSVTALDADRNLLARYGTKLVHVPWQHRPSQSPICEEFLHRHELPISDRNYFSKTFTDPKGADESFRERLQRFLEDHPNAFEVEYVRVVLAWLWRHEGREDLATSQLRTLLTEVPEDCVPGSTARWLLSRIQEGQPAERHLLFQAKK